MRLWTAAVLAALLACATIVAAQAAPLADAARGLTAVASHSGAESVVHRRCRWREGIRYCRRLRTATSNQPYPPIGLILGIR
jgi:Spy/CpxP family protein refolding chaperone